MAFDDASSARTLEVDEATTKVIGFQRPYCVEAAAQKLGELRLQPVSAENEAEILAIALRAMYDEFGVNGRIKIQEEQRVLLRGVWRLAELEGKPYEIPAYVRMHLTRVYRAYRLADIDEASLDYVLQWVFMEIQGALVRRGMPRDVRDIIVACEEFGRLAGDGLQDAEKSAHFMSEILELASMASERDIVSIHELTWGDVNVCGDYIAKVMRSARGTR